MSEKHDRNEIDMTRQTIKHELCQINRTLANVMQKDDRLIRTIVKEIIAAMKGTSEICREKITFWSQDFLIRR